MAVAVAVAVAVSGGGAAAVAGLTKRFFNHIQKDFLIDVWVYNCCNTVSPTKILESADKALGQLQRAAMEFLPQSLL